MRLLTFFLFTALMSAHASGFSQTVTLNGKELSLKEVFTAVKKQTGYVLFSNVELLADTKPVTLSVKDMPLAELLGIVLNGQSLDFVIQGKTIFLSNREKALERYYPDPPFRVSGTVRNQEGKPLQGATVLVKGSTKGAATLPSGHFTIEGLTKEVILQISMVGYETMEIGIRETSGGRTAYMISKGQAANLSVTPGSDLSMDIVLPLSDAKLNEVQILAYGSTTRRLNTGSVTTIKTEDIEKQPVNNPLFALQGRVPGLEITPTTGQPGGYVNLQIRGNNSLNFQTEPLIVVDGLPVQNTVVVGGPAGWISSLSFINPNDIASIDVLKDSDATSIYGSRGANGVILITTKKGKPGRTSADINIQKGWSDVAERIPMLNREQYLDLRREAFVNSGIDLSAEPILYANVDMKLWDTTRYTNWQDALLGATASYTDVQAAINGGSELIQYKLSATYHKEAGIFSGDNFMRRGSTHFNLTNISPNRRLKTSLSAGYMSDLNTMTAADLTMKAMTLSPVAPTIYKPDGTLNWALRPSGRRSWENPHQPLLREYDSKINNLLASLDISYEILPSLTLKTLVAYNDMRNESFHSYPIAAMGPDATPPVYGQAQFINGRTRNLGVDPQLTFNKKIGPGQLDALLGSSYQSTESKQEEVYLYGFTSDALLRNMSAALPEFRQYTGLYNSFSEFKYTAVFGQLNYNWENKYLLRASVRRDGSSRFGPGNKFGTFASVGTAWIFSEEALVKQALPVLSFGKFRFSYGSSGNGSIGDYQYLERFRLIDNLENYQGVIGYRSNGLVNPYFQWEVTKKMEFALETGFFRDRILFTAAYFQNRSSNLLLQPPYPMMAGPGTPLMNLPAVIQNMGWELTLSTDNIKTKEFKWSTDINFTRNRNKLVKYPGLDQSPYIDFEIGKPFYGIAKLYNYAGVNPETGIYQFKTAEGNIVSNPEDFSRMDGGRYVEAMLNPKYYGGISNSFSYRGFTLDVFFQFRNQLVFDLLTGYTATLSPGSNVNLPVQFMDRWRKPGDISNIQKVFAYSMPTEYRLAADFKTGSTAAYTDGSFLRLKNASLSYSIPAAWKSKLKIDDLRLYLHGQNLWTMTKYLGLDPETRTYFSMPPLRTITAGIRIGL